MRVASREIHRAAGWATLAVLGGCQLLSGVVRLDVDLPDDADASADGAADTTADGPPVSPPDSGLDSESASDGVLDVPLETDAGTDTLVVTVRLVGGGALDSLSVNSVVVCQSGATDCSGKHFVKVPRGTTASVHAEAQPESDAHFLEPASCKTTGSDCLVPSTGQVTVQVVAANYVFLTHGTYPGNVGGLAGADMKCSSAAASAGLPGVYTAWLSANGTNARDRLGAARGFVRVDGLPFADTVANLAKGQIFYPIALDETGVPVSPHERVMTGTLASGNLLSPIYSCAGWTDDSGAGFLLEGRPTGGTISWTHLESLGTCEIPRHIACMRTDRDVPIALPVPPTGARRVFISNGPAPMGDAGADGIDTRCQSEAQGNLTGTFRAFLATTTSSASARFNLGGGGWYRVDGMPIFPIATDLGTATVLPAGAVSQHADGTYVNDFPSVNGVAWTRVSPYPNQPASGLGFTCNDWTLATGLGGETGILTVSDQDFWGIGARHYCDESLPVLCLQD